MSKKLLTIFIIVTIGIISGPFVNSSAFARSDSGVHKYAIITDGTLEVENVIVLDKTANPNWQSPEGTFILDITDRTDKHMIQRGSIYSSNTDTFAASPQEDSQEEEVAYFDSTSISLYDIAENYPTKDISLEPGEIVSLDINFNGPFVKRAEPGDILLGAISEEPAVLLGGSGGQQYKNEYQVAVALSGRINVKVSIENGPITIGDRITISSVSGIGAKAIQAGQTIGIALESYNGTGDKQILVFVSLNSYGGDLSITEQDGQLVYIDPEQLRIGLASLGLIVNTNGILEVDTIKARKVQLKLIEIIDSISGDIYCTWLENGDWVKVQGECNTIEIEGGGGGDSDIISPVITLLGVSPIEVVVGDAYVDAGATAADDVDGDITANIITNSTVDTTTIGSYTVTYNVSDTAGNVATGVTRTVNVVDTLSEPAADTTLPVITLIGSSTIELVVGDTYIEEGATALDDIDGDVTANITTVPTVDTSVAGTYTVIYNVSDAAGNTATEVTRTVNVTEPVVVDTTSPVITLLGPDTVELVVGGTYIEDGATSEDDIDGDITANIVTVSTVDTAIAGSYTVTYNVSDMAGNEAIEIIRIVNVVDL